MSSGPCLCGDPACGRCFPQPQRGVCLCLETGDPDCPRCAAPEYEQLVREFHLKYGHDAPTFRRYDQDGLLPPNTGLAMLRTRLIIEEAAELCIALHQRDSIEVADALADLLYVVFGTAIAYGIPIGPVFEEVHRANMSKTPLNQHQKGGKGPGYEPPNLRKTLGLTP